MPQYTGPHDYFDERYVTEWTGSACAKRPFREDILAAMVEKVKSLPRPAVFELGSGPGFLAERILLECDVEAYHLFDFSPLMLDMSRSRLARFGGLVHFHQGSFLDEGWWQNIPYPFDAILSLQAVHEVRDVVRIPRLFSELNQMLKSGGVALIADKVNNELDKEQHHLTAAEHVEALAAAKFQVPRVLLEIGDLALFCGRRA